MGGSNFGTAEIERDGKFWFEDLKLPDGTSTLTLTAVDYWVNVTTTNVSVNKSSVQLAIIEPNQESLKNLTITVSDHTVWVNGVKATLNSPGTSTAPRS